MAEKKAKIGGNFDDQSSLTGIVRNDCPVGRACIQPDPKRTNGQRHGAGAECRIGRLCWRSHFALGGGPTNEWLIVWINLLV